MPGQLARLVGCLTPHFRSQRPTVNSSFDIPFKQDVTNEVSEYAGILLVRLGGCSTMQVRLQPDGESVLIRIVPMAKATRIEGEAPWQAAPDSQMRAWIQSESAVWQWLIAKGIDEGKARRLAESTLPVAPPAPRSHFFALRSKSSLSLP
jgi:hypothetical protein